MLVDDNAGIRAALRRILPAFGFEVCAEAENGPEALEKIQGAEPEIVVLDLSMPAMNGLQLADALHKSRPRLPILLYTAHAGPVVTRLALECGVSAVVDKIERMAVLIQRMQDLVERR